MRVAEKWDGRMPGVGEAGGDVEAARAARRGRGGRDPRHRGVDAAQVRRPRAPARARARDRDREHQLAPDGPAPPAQRAAPARPPRVLISRRRARAGSRPSRRPTRRGAIPARTRSRDSRSATANALESSRRRRTASWRAARCCALTASTIWKWDEARCRTRFASRRSSSGLRSQSARAAPRAAAAHAALFRPDHAEPEERRHDGEPEAGVLGDEVLDRREHAVALAALAQRREVVREAAGPEPLDAGVACPRPPGRAGGGPRGSRPDRSSRRGARAASRRHGRAAGAARRRPRSAISRSSSLTVNQLWSPSMTAASGIGTCRSASRLVSRTSSSSRRRSASSTSSGWGEGSTALTVRAAIPPPSRPAGR